MSVLSDRELRAALQASEIFEQDTWNNESILGASYVLRLGRYVDYPHASESATGEDGHRVLLRHRLEEGQKVDLAPGQTILATVQEKFCLSNKYLGLTVPRGLMFAEALQVATSYVDPGYNDDFLVPITNVSDRTVKLPYCLPLVRLFVLQLSSPAARPFRRWDRTSIAEELEAVASVSPPDESAVRALPTDALLDVVRTAAPSGAAIAEAVDRANQTGTKPVFKGSDYKDALEFLSKTDGVGQAVSIMMKRRQFVERTLFAIAMAAVFTLAAATAIASDESLRQLFLYILGAVALGALGSATWAGISALFRRSRPSNEP